MVIHEEYFTMSDGIRLYTVVALPDANVKGHLAKVTETKIATNTVVCDEDAYIILPKRKCF